MLIFIGFLLLYNSKLGKAITCFSYSGSVSSNIRDTTNVTGPGNACCAVNAWAGTYFGVTYKPYDFNSEVCCKGDSYFVGSVQYQSSIVGKGNTCCKTIAYDNNTGICCSAFNSQSVVSNAGPGDSCCGFKPYYKKLQSCCESYISAIHLTVYTVADGCCKFGAAPYNKSYQVCCNEWQIGNGDSCCNFNGEENGNEPPDVPYYKSNKCCLKGKLYDYVCLNKAAVFNFLVNKQHLLFFFSICFSKIILNLI